jgi:hypothetical protein
LDTKFWLVWNGLGVRVAGVPLGEGMVAGMISVHRFYLGRVCAVKGRGWQLRNKQGEGGRVCM